ncbi:hypothetical protein TNCV_3910191 [Trichonephila clavipes]|nr:hypothetical protein TNCV_3910191 [Trichonephila clavipes]
MLTKIEQQSCITQVSLYSAIQIIKKIGYEDIVSRRIITVVSIAETESSIVSGNSSFLLALAEPFILPWNKSESLNFNSLKTYCERYEVPESFSMVHPLWDRSKQTPSNGIKSLKVQSFFIRIERMELRTFREPKLKQIDIH